MKVNSNEMLPEGYKMTELGALPEEWELVRLGKATKTIKGRKPNYLSQSLQEKSIPYLTAEYFRTGIPSRFVLKEGNDFIEVGKDEIVFIWDGSNAGDVFIGLDGALASTMIKIIPDNFIYPKFLYYFLKTTYDFLNAKTTGSTIPHINKNLFNNLSFPLPPLPEQQKIAAVLSAVQEAKEKTQAVIDATKALKKSMMKHLFTYGPVPPEETENVPLKETEIGKVPVEWEVVKLGEIAENRKETVDPNKEDIIYVGLEHINSGDSKLKRYGNSREIKSSKSRFYKDDILYAKLRPYLDKGILAEFEGICSTDILVIKPNKELINPQFLTDLLHMPNFLDFATKSMTGVNHPRTSWSILKTFKIPLLPLPVQQKIASILSAIDAKIEAEENKKQALEELFKTLLDNLMTAKIRVNTLDVPI
ncbi:MAG: restriction endonuclease subunit S [Bacteroidetes bacterium]|nr:restriction endonuclease subunit S [Bacteroidota bacterium]